MKRFNYGLVFALCCAACPVSADSIRAGGVLHEDVYIVTTKQHYHVHFPEEGRVEKLSRARRDVEAPTIDPDESTRSALKERFDAVRSEQEKAREDAAATTVVVDTEAYLARKALASAALFDAQFSHWRHLTTAQQERILGQVLNLSATKASTLHAERSTVQSRLEGLDAAKAEREAKLARSQAKRDAAKEDAERRNAADIYARLHERELVDFERGNSSYASDFWARSADTEMALEARRKAAADRAYRKEAGAHEAALNQVESAITQQERDAQAVENKARDAEMRYGAFLARIDELILAERAGYEPSRALAPLESWRGEDGLRTPVIAIDSPLWQLECRRDDLDTDGAFAITVFDADTDTPFTRIADKDFLGMRIRIFDRPGRYYFVVEQDSTRIPYSLTVGKMQEE